MNMFTEDETAELLMLVVHRTRTILRCQQVLLDGKTAYSPSLGGKRDVQVHSDRIPGPFFQKAGTISVLLRYLPAPRYNSSGCSFCIDFTKTAEGFVDAFCKLRWRLSELSTHGHGVGMKLHRMYEEDYDGHCPATFDMLEHVRDRLDNAFIYEAWGRKVSARYGLKTVELPGNLFGKKGELIPSETNVRCRLAELVMKRIPFIIPQAKDIDTETLSRKRNADRPIPAARFRVGEETYLLPVTATRDGANLRLCRKNGRTGSEPFDLADLESVLPSLLATAMTGR